LLHDFNGDLLTAMQESVRVSQGAGSQQYLALDKQAIAEVLGCGLQIP
jgi:hypothetical protein